MASNNKVQVMALVLCVFLIISSVQCRQLISVGSVKATAANGKPSCDDIYGIKPAVQCTDIIDEFGLDSDFFFSINPNLNCNAIFVGQWICVDGSA